MTLRHSIDRWAERQVLATLARIVHGQLTVHLDGGSRTFGATGGLTASVQINDRRFFRRVITGGEIGLGDSYMDGDWSTPDLVSLVRVMLANRDVVGALPSLVAWIPRASRAWRTAAATTHPPAAGGTSTNTTISATSSSGCFSTRA